MSLRRTETVGRVWTRILRMVDESSLITTEGVAVALRPQPPGRLLPTRMDYGYALAQLVKMQKRRLVRRAYPWTPGELWAIGVEGRIVLDALAHPIPRGFKSDWRKRRNAKRRRDVLRDIGLCINGPAHGKATHGCRCEACHETHGKSA